MNIEKLDYRYSFVTNYIQATPQSVIVAVAASALALLDIAYHTTALILKRGSGDHMSSIKRACIVAATYPVMAAIFGQKRLGKVHHVLYPETNPWRHARAISFAAAALGGVMLAAYACRRPTPMSFGQRVWALVKFDWEQCGGVATVALICLAHIPKMMWDKKQAARPPAP